MDLGVPGLFSKGHIPPTILRHFVHKRVWDTYFKFCFVRSPWDWVVSQFFYNFVRESRRKFLEVTDFDDGSCSKNSGGSCEHFDVETLTISDIEKVYDLLKNHKGIPDADSLFQHNYVYDESGHEIVDYVGRYERLQEDYAKILTRIGISAELPFANVTIHRPYTSYYTDETRTLVEKLYAIDIKKFNYSF